MSFDLFWTEPIFSHKEAEKPVINGLNDLTSPNLPLHTHAHWNQYVPPFEQNESSTFSDA